MLNYVGHNFYLLPCGVYELKMSFQFFSPKMPVSTPWVFNVFCRAGDGAKTAPGMERTLKNVPRTFKECGVQVYDDIKLYNSCVTGLRNCRLRP